MRVAHSLLNMGQKILAISAMMAVYLSTVGYVSQRASALAIDNFAADTLDTWHQITARLNISPTKTEPGDLTPFISAGFGALDLVVFGAEITGEPFKSFYQALEFPRLATEVSTTLDTNKRIVYRVGGIQALTLHHPVLTEGGVIFKGAPLYLIQYMNQKYDGQKTLGTSDNQGRVRFTSYDDHHYLLGVYPPFTEINQPAEAHPKDD